MFTLKKISTTISYLSMLLLILVMTGCSRQQNKQILSNLNNRKADFSETKNNITVKTKVLTIGEFGAIFETSKNKNNPFIFSNYNLVEIEITNNNNYSVILDNKKLYRDQKEMVKHLLKNNPSYNQRLSKDIAIKAGALSGAIIAFGAFLFYQADASTAFIAVLVSVPPLLITVPLTIGALMFQLKPGIRNVRINRAINKNILDLNKKTVIKANTKLKKIFLLEKRDFEEGFSLKLFNKDADQKRIIKVVIPIT